MSLLPSGPLSYPGPHVITLGYDPPTGNKFPFAKGSSIEDMQKIGTPPPPPPPPSGLTAPTITMVTPGIKSATVKWKKPANPSGPINYYNVMSTGQLPIKVPLTYANRIGGYSQVINNLTPGNVTFTVQIVYKNGPPVDSIPVTEIIPAPPLGSDAPSITAVAAAVKSATVHWKKPVYPLGPIDYYLIFSSQGQPPIKVVSTSFRDNLSGYYEVFKGLTTSTGISFRVRVVYKDGTHADSLSSTPIPMAGSGRRGTRKHRRTVT